MLIKNKPLAFYLSLVLIALMFWNTDVMYPFRMLAVFFHETGHIIAALLTGGDIMEFTLEPLEGGRVLSSGGNRFLVAFMGYPASIIMGTLMVILADMKFSNVITLILGMLIGFLGVKVGSSTFTLIFSAFISLMFVFVALFFVEDLNSLLLRFVGLVSILYTPYDVISDVLFNSGFSDAVILSQLTKINPPIWGAIWIIISLPFIAFSLFWIVSHYKVDDELSGFEDV